MDYPEAIQWLYGRQESGIKLGLNNIIRLLKVLSLPNSDMQIVHVAGTNGKGSTCAFADSILRAAGHKTGLFTSPHLVSFCERISVNGTPSSRENIAEGLTRLRKMVADWEQPPTFFEIATALALMIFDEHGVTTAVVEVGLGGRLDSTNALSPTVCAITPISLDHRHILGDTIAKIAREKAGILKPGVPAVSALQPNEARLVLVSRAIEIGASLTFIDKTWEESNVPLPGQHQRRNAALAVASLERANFNISKIDCINGLAKTKWRGRFEQVPQKEGYDIIIDGAHNSAGAQALAETWVEVYGNKKPTVVFAAAANKDLPSLVKKISTYAANFICTRPNTLRKLAKPNDVAKLLPINTRSEYEDTVEAAIKKAKTYNRHVLITGSLFLAGEALSLLDKEHHRFEPSDQ